MPLRHGVVAAGFLWSLLGLCFLAYPLALFPPALKVGATVLFNLVHSISIPGSVLLCLLAVPVMLFFPWRLDRIFLWAVMALVTMLLVNIPKEMEYLDEYLMLFGYISIPLASAILLVHGYLDFKKIALWATVLWAMQILLAGISLYRQLEPVGTPGNINWLAGLLLMLTPWVIWYFTQFARQNIPNRKGATVLAAVVCLVPTAFILYHCHSRSAWLALFLLPVALVTIRMRRPLHKALVFGLLVVIGLGCLLGAYIYYPVQLLRIVEKDVRVPLWTGTGVMIAKHPLGVGSGAYQKNFTPLRRVSSYQNRLYAADMTVHPHNEILNVGAQLGIPAMLALMVMLATAFRYAAYDPLQICARISAYFAVMLSMFDMILVQPPTSFMGLFFLGLCWPVSAHQRQKKDGGSKWVVPKTALAGAAVCGMLAIAWMDISHDMDMRRGELAENMAYSSMNTNDRETGRLLLDEAIVEYKEAVTPFNRMVPYYKISRLSLMLPEKLDQAEQYLHRVAVMDPNFSHLNLLLGQLHLRKGDWAAAENYFVRECRFFPRSEGAWQNMYAFYLSSGQYGRLDAIDTLLEDIYLERARQNFGDHELATKQKAFSKALQNDDPATFLEAANELLDRINHNFTDPLFFEIVRKGDPPPAILERNFNILDLAAWRLRYTLFSQMQKELDALPASPKTLLSWYSSHIAIEQKGPLTFPLGVWNRRAGDALSAYLLFSMVCELNHYASIVCTDGTGQPAHAYVFVEQTEGKKESDRINIFQVDLSASICRPVPLAEFQKSFQWSVGRTFVYYATSDHFLRNQILGILVKNELPWSPQHPPSKRLLDLFAVTKSVPPSPGLLGQFCFDRHIRQHLERISALQPHATR